MLSRLPSLTGYMKICKEVIFPEILDTDFEEMYKDGGRPPISPKLLMGVTILQFLEKLPDRQTVQNLAFRLDWKIALGIEVDDPGVSYQVLSVWRQRLVEHDFARKIFDKLIEELKQRRLIKKSGKQRIDSTHILAEIKELSRVELMTETLRLACLDLERMKIELPIEIGNTIAAYEDGIKLYQIGSTERAEILKQAGKDMLIISEYIEQNISSNRLSKNLKTLILVLEQNFIIGSQGEAPELIKIATGKDHICSPHEPEARFGSKHKMIGYKAQITETAERDQVNFIVEVSEEDNQETDHGKLEDSLKRLEEKNLTPATMYADQGYISGQTIADSASQGVNALGPIENSDKGLNDEFIYEPEEDRYTCPEGKTTRSSHREDSGATMYRFSPDDCKNCSLRKKCRPKARNNSRDGRIIRRAKHHYEIIARRNLMKTEKYKEDMKSRNAIEGTISALKRGYGFVKCRYRGKKKFSLQMYFTAIAFNIKRFDMALMN